MVHSELLTKVMERIDEVGVNETVSLNFPIDPFIIESANQLLMTLPPSSFTNFVDFTSNPHTIVDFGSGIITLPDGFLKLYQFKMVGWDVIVDKAEPLSRDLVTKQQYKSTRATPASPLVAISGNRLFYYGKSINPALVTTIVEKALAICSISSSSDIEDVYGDIVSWLCASKVLQVMNEPAAAALALSQYNQLLPTFTRI